MYFHQVEVRESVKRAIEVHGTSIKPLKFNGCAFLLIKFMSEMCEMCVKSNQLIGTKTNNIKFILRLVTLCQLLCMKVHVRDV